MTLRQQALSLRGTRVRADFPDQSVVGELRYVTPAGELVFVGPGGFDYPMPLEALLSITEALLRCESCGDRVNRLTQGREDSAWFCAYCARKRAYALPPPIMDCADCGEAGAFRSPKTQAWRCASCHYKARTLSGLGTERRVLEHMQTDCRSADIHSPRHSWMKVKGNHVCRRCRIKTHLLSENDAAS